MNLPLIFEIAVGLIFIYLILSLLTSEIQELVATLFQWRAEHLKQSIENLITGQRTGQTNDAFAHSTFVDQLYNSPLIRSLNQEARGGLAQFFRQIGQSLIAIYRTLTGTRNVFGEQRSGPSYIPSETFAVALLQTINLNQLSQKISELTLKKFRDEHLDALQEILEDLRISLGDDPFLIGEGSLLEQEFKKIKQSLQNTIEDFASDRVSLSDCLNKLAEQIIQLIDNIDALLVDENHCKDIIRKRLSYLKQTVSRQHFQPSLTEVLRLLLTESEHRPNQISSQLSPWLAEIAARLQKESPELLQAADLPQPLRQNLLSLSNQARLKAKNLEAEVRQLEREVAAWFNHSMDRASGVYRRNAKGIAILIGFLVAVLSNADTFHMLDRLSRDSLLRSTITQAANQAITQPPPVSTSPALPLPDLPAELTPANPTPASPSSDIGSELQDVKNAVDETLNEIPLPIGWNAINVAQQETASRGWFLPILKRLLGWFLTGIALSMGATFWFDLLNRVVRVRSTGRKPEEEE